MDIDNGEILLDSINYGVNLYFAGILCEMFTSVNKKRLRLQPYGNLRRSEYCIILYLRA